MLTKKEIDSRAKAQSIVYGLILLTAALVFTGCAAPATGRLQSSPEVTEAFKKSRILANHQYYVSGFQRIPYAIIAVDNNYQLRTGYWKPIDIDSTALSHMIYRMEYVYSLNPRGAWILDSEGNRLGVWYSSQYQTTVKRDKNDGITVVNPDPPDLRGIR
jgi:hypothetical protein